MKYLSDEDNEVLESTRQQETNDLWKVIQDLIKIKGYNGIKPVSNR